jgi:hypothetical protein
MKAESGVRARVRNKKNENKAQAASRNENARMSNEGRFAWVVIPTAAGIRRRGDAARMRKKTESERRRGFYALVWFESERVGGDRNKS